jgi:8-oxo-dGTP pyrophosphatase MutT (NUDIX family)
MNSENPQPLQHPAAVKAVEDLVLSLVPFDELEQHHIQDTLTWIQSGDLIFRLQKPAIPPKHLVSYFVLYDEKTQKILLGDHLKSNLWLPAGGHVELNEHPGQTVRRECQEELSIEAVFWQPNPLFLTATVTVGLTAGHTDVSLWYVLKGDQVQELVFDKNEFNEMQWFEFEEVAELKSDPHITRFIAKLESCLLDLLNRNDTSACQTHNSR